MVALVVVLLVVTLLLAVVTTGLLRSHADILRALHELGVGVGDPGGDPTAGAPPPRRIGPLRPTGRAAASVHDLEGVGTGGDAVVVSVATSPRTLLAFLSSGCSSCAALWSALADPAQLDLLPVGIRVVVVTKGPEWESPDAIAARAPRGVAVIMSTGAWSDYEVPGSPFFVLLDGTAGARVGEGVAASWEQVADLVHRADTDGSGRRVRAEVDGSGQRGRAWAAVDGSGRRGRTRGVDPSGAAREAANDIDLRAAGITPGHPSLYPRRLEDVFGAPRSDPERVPTTSPPD